MSVKKVFIFKKDNVHKVTKIFTNDLHDLLLEDKELKVTIDENKESRRDIQNRLQFHWYREMEQQGDKTAREYRADCKYYIGLPIMLRNGGELSTAIRKALESLTEEERLRLVNAIAVTSTFSVKEMTEYLTEIKRLYSSHGFYLTDKNDLYYQALGY